MTSSVDKWLAGLLAPAKKVDLTPNVSIPVPPPKIAKKKVMLSAQSLPSYSSPSAYAPYVLTFSSLTPSSPAFEMPPLEAPSYKRKREEPSFDATAVSAIVSMVKKESVEEGKEEKVAAVAAVPIPAVGPVPVVKRQLTVEQQVKNIVDCESNLATMVHHWCAKPKLQFTATIPLTQIQWSAVVSILEHKAGLTSLLGDAKGRTDTALGTEEFELYFKPTMVTPSTSSITTLLPDVTSTGTNANGDGRDRIRVITDRTGTIKKAVVLQPRDDTGIYNISVNLDLTHAKPPVESTVVEGEDDKSGEVDPLAGLFEQWPQQAGKQEVPLIVLKECVMNFNLDAEENYPVHSWMTQQQPISYCHRKLLSFYSPRGDFRFDCLSLTKGTGLPPKPTPLANEVKSPPPSFSSSSSSPQSLKIDFPDLQSQSSTQSTASASSSVPVRSYELRIVPLTTAWDDLKLDKSKSPSRMMIWVSSKKKPFPCVKGLNPQRLLKVPKSLSSPVNEWVDNLLFKCFSIPFNIVPGPPTDNKRYRLVYSILSVDGVSWQVPEPFRTQRQVQEQIQSAKTNPIERGEVVKKLRVL